jgi:fructose-1,6-bisphosphatase/inositol monophosphatase family enzyme
MTSDDLLELFERTAEAVRVAVARIPHEQLRARTDRPGQYALDLVADAAALEVLTRAPIAIMSEESALTGPSNSPITVVLDPVDGSTNCSRGIPYWATSLCAVDRDGASVGLVVNQATGSSTTAVRGKGAWRDGRPIHASSVRKLDEAVIAISSLPPRVLPWRQFRAMGSAALALCDVASGGFDGYVDAGRYHAPWDYLGGLIACKEAGAQVQDAGRMPLEVIEFTARRQLIAGSTDDLFRALLSSAGV